MLSSIGGKKGGTKLLRQAPSRFFSQWSGAVAPPALFSGRYLPPLPFGHFGRKTKRGRFVRCLRNFHRQSLSERLQILSQYDALASHFDCFAIVGVPQINASLHVTPSVVTTSLNKITLPTQKDA